MADKFMYLSMAVRPLNNAMSVLLDLAKTPGFVGFCPVFDNEESASKWGAGRYMAVAPATSESQAQKGPVL